MSRREIDIKLDNCIYGNIKFLYLSPERLKSEFFKARVVKMNIQLLVVDEAHCISEWGYDFRPSYLAIAEIRLLLPDIAILALTATATAEVKDDIIKQLNFKDGVEFQVSFARPNLSYQVEVTEDKPRQADKLNWENEWKLFDLCKYPKKMQDCYCGTAT